MAREIQIVTKLTVAKSNLSVIRQFSPQIDMSGNRVSSGATSIAAGGEGVVVPVSDVATAGIAMMINLDATNYVEIGIRVSGTFYPFAKLKPGEVWIGRLGTNAPYARAHTGACVLEYHIVED